MRPLADAVKIVQKPKSLFAVRLFIEWWLGGRSTVGSEFGKVEKIKNFPSLSTILTELRRGNGIECFDGGATIDKKTTEEVF